VQSGFTLGLMPLKPAGDIDAYTAPPTRASPISMFRHRQPLRRWAARVLLLWLFGLVAGIANACLTTGQAGPAAASHPPVAVQTGHGVAGQHHDHDDADALPSHGAHAQAQQGALAPANCADFCDKATVSIPSQKSLLDDARSPAGIAATAVAVLPRPALAPLRVWVPRQHAVLAPSIPIAFLRLAL
jgi:hypothetical protein